MYNAVLTAYTLSGSTQAGWNHEMGLCLNYAGAVLGWSSLHVTNEGRFSSEVSECIIADRPFVVVCPVQSPPHSAMKR